MSMDKLMLALDTLVANQESINKCQHQMENLLRVIVIRLQDHDSMFTAVKPECWDADKFALLVLEQKVRQGKRE